MPTTRPRLSASAPPELPGLSAASVWITSGIERCVAAAAGRQRPPERRDDAGRHRAAQAVGVADRDHELPDPQTAGVAELGGDEAGGVGADQRQVGQRVAADHLEGGLAAVGEGGPAAGVVGADHVGAGEHEAVAAQHDGAAAADAPRAGGGRRRTRRLATDGASRSATA